MLLTISSRSSRGGLAFHRRSTRHDPKRQGSQEGDGPISSACVASRIRRCSLSLLNTVPASAAVALMASVKRSCRASAKPPCTAKGIALGRVGRLLSVQRVSYRR